MQQSQLKDCPKGGLQKLARIARKARGNSTFREFKAITDIAHIKLWNLEVAERIPDYLTLQKLLISAAFAALPLFCAPSGQAAPQ